jgi:hypothetical protein
MSAAQAQGRRGGRPAAVNDDILAIARARHERGESVTLIASHLGIGRSSHYRGLDSDVTASRRFPRLLRPSWAARRSAIITIIAGWSAPVSTSLSTAKSAGR